MRGQKKKTVGLLIAACMMAGFYNILFAGDSTQRLSIADALDVALRRNPHLKMVRAQRDATEARVWEAKSSFLPQIRLSSGFTRYSDPNIIVPIHQQGVFPPLDNDIFETVTQINLPIFSGGRRIAATRSAKASAQESAAQEDLSGSRLIQSVTQVYVQSQELQDQKALILARLNVLQQRHKELSQLLKEGRISMADLALVNSNIETVRSDSIAIEAGFYELSLRLAQLLGMDEPVLPAEAGLESDNKSAMALELPEPSGESSSPEVRKAQAQLGRAQAQLSQVSRAFWPEISGFASYMWRSGDDLNMTGEWAAGISISLPIFEGGRRIAGVQTARASLRAAKEQARSVQQANVSALRIARNRWQTSTTKQKHMRQAVEAKSRSVTAQKQLYNSGRISLSELQTQETDLLQLQSDERSAAYAILRAALDFHATAGSLHKELAERIVRKLP